MNPTDVRADIVTGAKRALADDPGASIETISRAAGVSRATLYRHFRSKADVLAAADVEPDPGTRARVLAAAAGLVGRDGLAALSMDELATVAGVSRASVYRLFPGKPALFAGLIEAYSPFEPVIAVLDRLGDRPPDEVLPEVARVAARVSAPRIGLLRSVLLEITSGSPEAVSGAMGPMQSLLAALGGYVTRQMAAGHIRPMHPLLAIQMLIGPVVFHLLTRSMAERLTRLDLTIDEAVEQLAAVTVTGLTTITSGDANGPNR
jgi:AcrR family transcriptional regulator